MNESKQPLGFSRHEDGSLKLDGTAVLASLGGVLGILEASVPSLAFGISYAFWHQVVVSVVVGTVLSLAFIIGQIIRRRPLAQAVFGLAATGLAAYLALQGDSGSHARDYFLPGLLTNVAYLGVITLSILIRWPVIGIIMGLLQQGSGWRKNKKLMRKYTLVSLIWVGMFSIRLLIEVPMYLANQVVVLGFTKLFLSTPFYAVCVWFTWLTLRKSPAAVS